MEDLTGRLITSSILEFRGLLHSYYAVYSSEFYFSVSRRKRFVDNALNSA